MPLDQSNQSKKNGGRPDPTWSTQQYADYLAGVAFNDPDRLAFAVWEVTSQRVLKLLISQMCSLIGSMGPVNPNLPGTDTENRDRRKHRG
jgi:hypothetical protein